MGTNTINPTGAANSSYPFLGAGSTKVREGQVIEGHDPGVRTFVYEQITYVYTVQPGDTLAKVAKLLFGTNSKHWRDHLRRNGFEPGATINYQGALKDGQ